MDKHTQELLVSAVINMASRLCHERDCSAELKSPGTRNRHVRCSDCPLDDVDHLADRAFDEEAADG